MPSYKNPGPLSTYPFWRISRALAAGLCHAGRMKILDATGPVDAVMHLLVGLPFRSTDPLEAPKYDLLPASLGETGFVLTIPFGVCQTLLVF
jgi:hypothetical protein